MDLKDSKIMRFCSVVFIVMLSVKLVFSQTDDELVEIAKNAYDARWSAANKEERVRIFQQHFEGLSDEFKIKAILLRLYDVDQNPKWSMSSEIIMGPQYALADEPDFITDWSTLREMLKAEKSPRKFYLLSELVPWTSPDKQHDFVAERTHMLFADGRVAKDEGEYTKSYAHDVSAYAYKAIIGNLKALGADFEPPAKNLPHEKQAVILAKWLKENWPRCENIEIPPHLLGEGSRPRKSLKEKPRPSPAQIREQDQEMPTDTIKQNGQNPLLWVIGGVLLLGVVVFFVRALRRGRAS